MTKNSKAYTFVIGKNIEHSSELSQLLDMTDHSAVWSGFEYAGSDYDVIAVDCETKLPTELHLTEEEALAMLRSEIAERVSERIFVLGSMDPEMEEIRRVLSLCGLPHIRALSGFLPVNPRTAYEADPGPGSAHIWIECAPKGGTQELRLDHHKPGDAGYGLEPKLYRTASSLGQLLTLLGLRATRQQCIIMAADHCLGAAYAGKCPQVNRDDLLGLYFSRFAEEDQDLERRAFDETLSHLVECRDQNYSICPMTDRAYPHLPVAASYLGVCYTSIVSDSDGRKKEVLGGNTTPEIVSDWMRLAAERGLTGIYGDPVRGFAGGYLP